MPLKIPNFTDNMWDKSSWTLLFAGKFIFNGKRFFIARSISCKTRFGLDVGSAYFKICTSNFFCRTDYLNVFPELSTLFSRESNSDHTKKNQRGYNKIFGDTCLYLLEIKFLTWKIVTALLPIVTYSCVIYQVSIYVTYKKLCSRQKLSYHCHIHK